jgi:alpha-1,3-rhamnosyl/mannosyltransferase
MPEVAGDASFLVNPLQVNDIASAMHCVATDSNFSRQLSVKGLARAEDFHWDSCATAVAEIYKRVAKNPGKAKRASLSPVAKVPQPQALSR